MFSTREVLGLLRKENPHKQITEDQIRRALRNEAIRAPSMIAGRFAWLPKDVSRLVKVLKVRDPFFEETRNEMEQ